MSIMREFIAVVDDVAAGEGAVTIDRELADALRSMLAGMLEGAVRAGKASGKARSRRVKTDRKSKLNRERVRRFREKQQNGTEPK